MKNKTNILPVEINIPDIIFKQYESIDDIQKNIFEDIIIGQRQKGKLTIRESAKLLRISYIEFIKLLGKRCYTVENTTEEERKASLKRLKKILKTNK